MTLEILRIVSFTCNDVIIIVTVPSGEVTLLHWMEVKWSLARSRTTSKVIHGNELISQQENPTEIVGTLYTLLFVRLS